MSEMDLELERLRQAFASLEGRAPGPGCPEPERLWSAARGELPAEVVRPLVRHLVECGACAEAWRLALEVEPRPAQPSAAVARRAPPRLSGMGWGALAAGMAVALAASVVLRQQPEGRPGFREGARNDIRSLISEVDPLPRTRCVLRWSPGPEGTTYNVQVATERLEKVSEARGLRAAAYQVPPGALGSLSSGAKLLWRVEAVAPDGGRATSATFLARVE
jgi:hypothetical protein